MQSFYSIGATFVFSVEERGMFSRLHGWATAPPRGVCVISAWSPAPLWPGFCFWSGNGVPRKLGPDTVRNLTSLLWFRVLCALNEIIQLRHNRPWRNIGRIYYKIDARWVPPSSMKVGSSMKASQFGYIFVHLRVTLGVQGTGVVQHLTCI